MIKLPLETFKWLVKMQVVSNKKIINTYKEREYVSLQFEETSMARDGTLLIQIGNKICDMLKKSQNKIKVTQKAMGNNLAQKNWEVVQQLMKILKVPLMEQNIQDILRGDLQQIQNLIQQLFQRFSSQQENQVHTQNNSVNVYQDIYEDRLQNNKTNTPSYFQSQQNNMSKSQCMRNSRQILKPIQPVNYSIIADSNSQLNMFSNEIKYKGKKIQNLDNQYINKDYIQKKEVQNSLNLVHKDKKLTNSETVFEGVLLLISRAFDTEPLKNLPLFLNQNELLKQLVKSGEKGYGFERVDNFIILLKQYSKALINLLNFKEMDVNLKKDFELFLLFWIDILNSSNNTLYFDCFWQNYLNLFEQLQKYKFFWLLQDFLEQNSNFYKTIFKLASKKSSYYQNIFQLHADYLLDTSYFLSIQQTFVNSNFKQYYFQMINTMFKKQENMMKQLLEQKKFYFDFLLKAVTSNFYSYGLKLDHGFETHSLIPQVEFSQFFECSKLYLQLLTINRYKIQNNITISFIDKILQFFNIQKQKQERNLNQSLKMTFSNSSKYQLILLVITCHKKFYENNFEIKTKIENLFINILCNDRKEFQDLKPMILDYFDTLPQENAFIQSFFSQKFLKYIDQLNQSKLDENVRDTINIRLHQMFEKYFQNFQLNSQQNMLEYCNKYMQLVLEQEFYEFDIFEKFLDIIKKNQSEFDFQIVILKLLKKQIDLIYDFEIKIQQEHDPFNQLFKIFSKHSLSTNQMYSSQAVLSQKSTQSISKQNSSGQLQKQNSEIPLLSCKKENLFNEAINKIFEVEFQSDQQSIEKIQTSKASRKVVQLLKETKKICEVINIIKLSINCQIKKINKTVLLLLLNKRQSFFKNTACSQQNVQKKPFFLESLIQIFGEPETLLNNTEVKEKLDQHIKYIEDQQDIENIYKQVLDTKLPTKKKYETAQLRLQKDKNYAYKAYVKTLSRKSQYIKKQQKTIKKEESKKVVDYDYKAKQIEKIPLYEQQLVKEELEVIQNHFEINKKLYKKLFKHMYCQNYKYGEDQLGGIAQNKTNKNENDNLQQCYWNYNIVWQFFINIRTQNKITIKDIRNSIRTFCPNEIILFQDFDKILFQMIYLAQKKGVLISQDTFEKLENLLQKYKDKNTGERVYISMDENQQQSQNVFEEKKFSDGWQVMNRNEFWIRQIVLDLIPDQQTPSEYINIRQFYFKKQQQPKCEFNYKFEAYNKTIAKIASEKQKKITKRSILQEQKRKKRVNEIKQIIIEKKKEKLSQQKKQNDQENKKRSKIKLKYYKLKKSYKKAHKKVQAKRKIKKKYKAIQSQYMNYEKQQNELKDFQQNFHQQETNKIQQQTMQQTLKQKTYADKILKKISQEKKQHENQSMLNETRIDFFQTDQQTLSFFQFNMEYLKECYGIFVNQHRVSLQFELKKRISIKGIQESFSFIGIIPNLLDSQELIKYYNLYLNKHQLNSNQITFRIYVQFLFYIIYIDQNIEKYYQKNKNQIKQYFEKNFENCEFIDTQNQKNTLLNIINDFIKKEKSILKKLDSLMQENQEFDQNTNNNPSIPFEQINNNLKALIYLINSQELPDQYQKVSDLRTLGYQVFKKVNKKNTKKTNNSEDQNSQEEFENEQ